MGNEVKQLLNNYSPEVQGLSMKLREMIQSLVPEAEENVSLGWKIIGYNLGKGMKGQFCSIGPLKTYINLYFSHGTGLSDPEGILEGTGKNIRHVKVRNVDDIQREEVKLLIEEAASLTKSEE
jgi:hypothetical protein